MQFIKTLTFAYGLREGNMVTMQRNNNKVIYISHSIFTEQQAEGQHNFPGHHQENTAGSNKPKAREYN